MSIPGLTGQTTSIRDVRQQQGTLAFDQQAVTDLDDGRIDRGQSAAENAASARTHIAEIVDLFGEPMRAAKDVLDHAAIFGHPLQKALVAAGGLWQDVGGAAYMSAAEIGVRTVLAAKDFGDAAVHAAVDGIDKLLD